ncbi:hypothetical protein DDZ16_05020 [Marinilabilia rubra]|uniref:Uncharacterized protein n=2 Tax=Marinilabilia rubra TaxID=2162893 RepID=A0A2U2BB55_9BACT|nr:hypothetical protein DDZ16_05020 [Marinilabilia rubra]
MFTVWLKDPLHPDLDAQAYTVQVYCDEHGVPIRYRLPLVAQTCYDNTCKPMDVVLYWNGLGDFVNLEPVPGRPLTKTEKETRFSEEDYKLLGAILQDKRSVLKHYQLKTIGAEKDEAVDALSGATQPFLQGAVIPGAVYTTWVLWYWANGDVVEQLKAKTRQKITKTDVVRFLASEDLGKVRFALHMAIESDVTSESIFQTLKVADHNTAKLALHTLEQMNVEVPEMKLVELLGSTSEAAEWGIIDFIGNRNPGPVLLLALKKCMPDLTFIGKHKVKMILKDNLFDG